MPRLAPAIALVLAALPAAALGCPSCYGSGSERVIEAYQASTLFLSLLPFGIVGAIGATAWWLADGGGEVAPAAPDGGRSA